MTEIVVCEERILSPFPSFCRPNEKHMQAQDFLTSEITCQMSLPSFGGSLTKYYLYGYTILWFLVPHIGFKKVENRVETDSAPSPSSPFPSQGAGGEEELGQKQVGGVLLTREALINHKTEASLMEVSVLQLTKPSYNHCCTPLAVIGQCTTRIPVKNGWPIGSVVFVKNIAQKVII